MSLSWFLCVGIYICTHIHIYRVQDISRWLSHSLLLGNCLGKRLFRAGRMQQQKVGALVPSPLPSMQKYAIRRWPKPSEVRTRRWWGAHGKDEEFEGSKFLRGRRKTSRPSQEKKISTGRSSYWLHSGEILQKRKKAKCLDDFFKLQTRIFSLINYFFWSVFIIPSTVLSQVLVSSFFDLPPQLPWAITPSTGLLSHLFILICSFSPNLILSASLEAPY